MDSDEASETAAGGDVARDTRARDAQDRLQDSTQLDWRAIRDIYGVDATAQRDWRGIENAYVRSGCSLRRIGQAFGASARTIAARAKTFGWVREVPTVPLPTGPKSPPPGAPHTFTGD